MSSPEARALAARLRELVKLRIVLACGLSASTSIAVAERWAALPEAVRSVPEGVGWLVPRLRIDVPTVRGVRAVFHVAAALAGLGLATRASWLVTTLTADYLLLVPQLGGAVFHDHHLLWLAVISGPGSMPRARSGARTLVSIERSASAR
jgi:hypothetical protein